MLGPNGAGKNTLMSLLNGLREPTAGTMLLAGKPLTEERHQGGTWCSLVPQEYAFYGRLSVIDNLRFFGQVQNLNGAALQDGVRFVVDACGLQEHTQKRADQLSGGIKRRLNLAISLLRKPALLFLDEPTVGIDAQSRHFILDLIKRLRDEGMTIVYTSHYMDEVQAICDELAIIDHGELVAGGNLQELLRDRSRLELHVQTSTRLSADQLQSLAGNPRLEGDELVFAAATDEDVTSILIHLAAQGIDARQIHWGVNRLEQVYVDITRKALRD